MYIYVCAADGGAREGRKAIKTYSPSLSSVTPRADDVGGRMGRTVGGCGGATGERPAGLRRERCNGARGYRCRSRPATFPRPPKSHALLPTRRGRIAFIISSVTHHVRTLSRFDVFVSVAFRIIGSSVYQSNSVDWFANVHFLFHRVLSRGIQTVVFDLATRPVLATVFLPLVDTSL